MNSSGPDIIFPNLGIEINKLNEVAFMIFGIEVYWYGILIGSGILGGLAMASFLAKRSNQDTEIYTEFLMWAIISAIVGARVYYVINSWDNYKDNILDVFKLRDGGLGFYGGLIAACITLIIFTKVKKLNFWILADTAAPGVFVGQIFGRIGNFMNKEAFGGYSDNILSMAIKRTEAKYVPDVLKDKIVEFYGTEYIQVQPMFLYEIMWNFVMLILLLLYFRKRRFDGEIFALYFFMYGIGRAWMENMRTDQLLIGHTNIPISVAVSIILVIVSVTFILIKRIQANRNNLPKPNDI